MTSSIKPTLRRVLATTEGPASEETLEHVGRSIDAFLQAERHGSVNAHPEAFIVELPIQDHETARKCFDMLELLNYLENTTIFRCKRP